MDQFLIQGGIPLSGEVQVSGAKNSALKLLIASLLCEGRHYFRNVPNLVDIHSTAKLLETLGVKTFFENDLFICDVGPAQQTLAHYDLVRKMRASILVLGPLLTKYGRAQVSLPGGCAIGNRPIDLHIEALRQMGAEITIEEGYVHARASRLKGTKILFDQVTVGGTENVLMAAVLAEGKTVIENAAKEPEIVDLANFLITLGAKIKGQGTSCIEIEGVNSLRASGKEYVVMPDRIEAGTLLLAGAITGGRVKVQQAPPFHLEALFSKLREAGFKIVEEADGVTLESPSGGHRAVDVTTAPYPHFPTDLQAQFMALMCFAHGTSVITETVFENRFMHVPELMRMGADITSKSRVAVVRGRPRGLTGAPVMATDLRASASLVLAGLAAQGQTTVNRIYHLDRGYERLEQKLQCLGAKVERIAT
ncbi:MAG: UDP-N-acetylglucosamine 1-carboxyvinyltransferase [Bdellovibrionaceae bacterium]|nr:UDP-N-acetylglucosamine 1-carboxyvinyltransferase [Pseudobdellovibrionaceae bacterium]MDW8190288.1 UDP-N-acetylglucosamine 1-carboxyvinyltransferase [Pseudobdellovibrionaceae bacterium]